MEWTEDASLAQDSPRVSPRYEFAESRGELFLASPAEDEDLVVNVFRFDKPQARWTRIERVLVSQPFSEDRSRRGGVLWFGERGDSPRPALVIRESTKILRRR